MAGHIPTHTFPYFFPTARIDGAQRLFWVAMKRLALPLLCLGAFALRLNLLAAWPFREDEAMYSVWALHLWQVDPQALTLWPDKPPLFLWLLGGVFQLFGPSEAGARLLNIAADTLVIGVVAATGRSLWGSRAGLLAGLAYAFNPFAISFAPTAYTDPTLILWGSLALYAAIQRRGFWAGLFLAAAIATKQQGLLYAPLIVGVILLAPVAGGRGRVEDDGTAHSPFAIRHSPFTIRFLLGLALLLLPVLLWDASRWAVAPSPWDLSVRNYAPLALLPPGEWLPRLAQWGEIGWYLVGSWLVIGYWGLGSGDWGVGTGDWGLGSGDWGMGRPIPDPQSPIPPLLLLWSCGFVLLHVTSSVQIWDRYLLPLAPLAALALGRAGARLAGGRSRGWLAGLLLLLILLPPGLAAAQGGLPVGADHGDYAGLNESIAWLRVNAPAGGVVYHRDVSWQLRFAFFAVNPSQSDGALYELRWFPNAVYLADNGAKTAARRKFLIEPAWAVVDSASQRLAQRGLGWEARLRAGNFTLYELTSPPALPCDWCICADRTEPYLPKKLLTPSPSHLFTPSSLP